MTLLQAILLGIVQGASEFIPISSSAHLVLIPWLLGWDLPSLTFDTILHLGTLLAVAGFFYKDWWALIVSFFTFLRTRNANDPSLKLLLCIVVGTIPAALIGVLFKDFISELFQSPMTSAVFLLVTAAILLVAEGAGKQERNLERITVVDGLIIGLTQAIAILPGVSRSGSTIGAGMMRGLNRSAAARFSFLLSGPIILGAGVVGVLDLIGGSATAPDLPILIAGFAAAFVTGMAVIAFLIKFLTSHSLRVFAIYCILFSIVCLAAGFLGLRSF